MAEVPITPRLVLHAVNRGGVYHLRGQYDAWEMRRHTQRPGTGVVATDLVRDMRAKGLLAASNATRPVLTLAGRKRLERKVRRG